MRNRLLLVLAVCVLAGCGGKSSTSSSPNVETAIAAKQVAKLFVRSTGLVSVSAPVCVQTAIAGNYNCTGRPKYVACAANSGPSVPCESKTAPTKAWIDCFPNPTGPEKFFCQVENPPAGTDVFVTPAQKAAQKVASWKCVTTNQAGQVIGPYSVSIAGSFGPVQSQVNYVTKTQAGEIAKQAHLRFVPHC